MLSPLFHLTSTVHIFRFLGIPASCCSFDSILNSFSGGCFRGTLQEMSIITMDMGFIMRGPYPQWQFAVPKLTLLYHVKPYFGVYSLTSPYIDSGWWFGT